MILTPGMRAIPCNVVSIIKTMTYQVLVIKTIKEEDWLFVHVKPNWEGYIPVKGDTGYINFEYVRAGIDEYYDLEIKKHVAYKYDSVYFKAFVPDDLSLEYSEKKSQIIKF